MKGKGVNAIAAAVDDELPWPLANGEPAGSLMNGCLTNGLCRRTEQTRQNADAVFRRRFRRLDLQDVRARGEQVIQADRLVIDRTRIDSSRPACHEWFAMPAFINAAFGGS